MTLNSIHSSSPHPTSHPICSIVPMHSFFPEVPLTSKLWHAGSFCIVYSSAFSSQLHCHTLYSLKVELLLNLSLLLPYLKATKSYFFLLDCAFVSPHSVHSVSTVTRHPSAGALDRSLLFYMQPLSEVEVRTDKEWLFISMQSQKKH